MMMGARSLLRLQRFVLPFLVLASAAQAAAILDQSNLPDLVGLNDSLEWQQQVTAGLSGVLAGVELFARSGEPDTMTVSIGVGSGFFTGAYAFTTSALIVTTGTFIDTSAAGISLTPGEEFVIDVSGGSFGCCALAGSTSAYVGGDLFLNSGSVTDYTQQFGYSMGFQTFISGATAPEPGTLALFGSGLFGLLGLTWVRRRRA